MNHVNASKMRHSIVVAMYFLALTASAQLKVNSNGKVFVNDTVTTSPKAALTVGNCSVSQYMYNNIGLSASPVAAYNKSNVGVEGVVKTTATVYYDTNHGVRGYVDPYNGFGRNFGVSGIYNGANNYYGAGVYGATTFLSYTQPLSPGGRYAGYFEGDVGVTGTLSASSVVQTSDIRLKDNVVLLADMEEGSRTLDNLLNMNVIEYNLKYKTDYDFSDEALSELAKEHPEVIEDYNKQKEIFTSKRHYGLSAQELQELYPNLVVEGQDGYLAVNYIELVPILIRSIQELKAELDELKGSDARPAQGKHADSSSQTEWNAGLRQGTDRYPIIVDGKTIGKKHTKLSK